MRISKAVMHPHPCKPPSIPPVDDALRLVLEQAQPLPTVKVPLDQAAGCVLAEDIVVRVSSHVLPWVCYFSSPLPSLAIMRIIIAHDAWGLLVLFLRTQPHAHLHTHQSGHGAAAGVPGLHHGRLRGGGLRRAGCGSRV